MYWGCIHMKSKGRIILRSMLTLFLVCSLMAVLSTIFEYAEDEYRPEMSLMSALDGGYYSSMVDYYDTTRYLYGVDDEETYGRYTEFVAFYRSYILYVESKDSAYLTDMKQIMEDTVYENNMPHYEYLYDLAENG